MSEDSAAGKDGLPIELCRSSSCPLKEDFTDQVNYIFFEKTEITKIMKAAIISLITKTKSEETNTLLCVIIK